MIFNLFKSKPTLKELIPRGFVDIHSHVLPGLDDGAKNIEESIMLISEMKNLGISKIITTPHTYPGLYDNSTTSIIDSYEKVKNEIPNEVEFFYASEYMIGKYLIKEAFDKKLLTMKENHVLIEMSYISEPINLKEIVFVIMTNGFKPILAHPERYNFYFDDLKKYYQLKNLGLKFQLNLLSLTGYYGEETMRVSNKLLENNLIDYVGSDIHKLKHVQEFNKKIRIKKTTNLEFAIENNKILAD